MVLAAEHPSESQLNILELALTVHGMPLGLHKTVESVLGEVREVAPMPGWFADAFIVLSFEQRPSSIFVSLFHAVLL